MKLIECVPNISEGRNKSIISKITNVIRNNSKLHLLDVDSGYDTNRTVITFIGAPQDVVNGAFDLIKKSYELIDMSKHEGEHPRMGATDVCPLVPISGVTIKDCVRLSKELSKKVADNLNVPVYLY